MRASESANPARAPAEYVPALDGLRALSLLLVIGYHADVPHLSGGFLGVEVFFVVSGYLITSLLLLEQARAGGISLVHFWLRRARRLLPALFSVLLATLALSLTVARDSLAQAHGDTLAALLYVSNWWQIVHHHSYFMDVDRPPLLLHLWSLAVEEQFYFFWPLVVALIGRWPRRGVLPIALLLSGASALWLAYLFDPNLDPTRLYIGTDTRLSGLLLGAALAVALPLPTSRSTEPTRAAGWRREILAICGLCALLGLVSRCVTQDPFLYRGGLVLVDLASCALIAGLVTRTVVARVLGAGPLAWLGRRSYGLYLWHWPIFAVTRPELDLAWSGVALLALRLLLTFIAAELCYRFVETPVRTGRARSLVLAAGPVLIVLFIAVAGTRSAAARLETRFEVATPAAAQPRAGVTSPAQLPAQPAALGIPLDPAWPKTLTLVSDSVGLDLSRSLPAALPEWKVEVLGRPALMVKQAVPEFLNARSVGSVVVIALAYNSLFERDHKNYARWSKLWDRNAEKLVFDLKACGAKKLIWITLREPTPELVTDAGRAQYERYAWFFPYVNERLRALAQRHPELALADWQAVANRPDVTKDLIHLNPAGVTLMTDTVTRAVLGPVLPGRATP